MKIGLPDWYLLQWFLGWWSDLPWWVRMLVALVPIAISTIAYFAADRLWIWGWIVGGVLLAFSFPSGPESKGYRF